MPWDRRALTRQVPVVFAVTALFAAVPVPAFAQAQILLLLGRPSIPSGAFTLGIVLLDKPAPEGGTIVTLASDTPAVVTFPASVTVPAEHTEAFFLVATAPVATTSTVLFAATAGSATSTAALILLGTDARLPGVNPASDRQAACDGPNRGSHTAPARQSLRRESRRVASRNAGRRPAPREAAHRRMCKGSAL